MESKPGASIRLGRERMGEPARGPDRDAPAVVSRCAPLRGSRAARLSFRGSPSSLTRQDGFRIPRDAQLAL
jgi:hypothetical protein